MQNSAENTKLFRKGRYQREHTSIVRPSIYCDHMITNTLKKKTLNRINKK